jgi:very-short-patch-repair endonuclease
LLDLAASCSEQKVAKALDQALHLGLTSVERLEHQVARPLGKPPAGTKALKKLLAERLPGEAPPESPLEAKVWALLTAAELPRPCRQHRVYDGETPAGRVDIAYPNARVAVEVDGYRWHSGREAWSRDLRRRNRLTALGWHVIHVTGEDLKRPQEIIDQVRALMPEPTCP